MSQDYQLVSEFKGYVTKKDATNVDERTLTAGSFNVLVNDEEKVSARKGYRLLGAASSSANPVESEFTWNTSTGTEILLRAKNNILQFLNPDNDTWTNLITGLGTSKVGFPKSSKSGWWDDSEGIDLLLFVAGDSNIYEWSGCVTSLASATTNTITKNGTETWAEARVNQTANKVVIINGTEYTYTGGETTTTLTGVTPDPSGEAVDSVIYQKVVTNANPVGASFTHDLIEILNNQVFTASFKNREIYGSTNTDFTDFSTISTPRTPGQAIVLTLDNVPKALVVQEENLYISAGKSDWYEVSIDLQTTSTAFVENINIKKLKNSSQQGIKDSDLLANIKNAVVFISNEPTLDQLGRIENITTPQSVPLSDPIKPDFDSYDFTGGDIEYFRNQIIISVPAESLLLIYDLANGWWQPPQQISIGKLSVYNDQLIGHSSAVDETYILFEDADTSDNGNVINMQAVFAYQNNGTRSLMKGFDEYFTEGYISGNTKLTMTIQYDFEGASSEKEFEIDGSDSSITFGAIVGGWLGSLPLGAGPLGTVKDTPTVLKKFRVVHGTREVDYYEMRVIYSTTDDDAQFEILAHGPQARVSQNQNNAITK